MRPSHSLPRCEGYLRGRPCANTGRHSTRQPSRACPLCIRGQRQSVVSHGRGYFEVADRGLVGQAWQTANVALTYERSGGPGDWHGFLRVDNLADRHYAGSGAVAGSGAAHRPDCLTHRRIKAGRRPVEATNPLSVYSDCFWVGPSALAGIKCRNAIHIDRFQREIKNGDILANALRPLRFRNYRTALLYVPA